jgi:putative endonuclease
MKKAYMYILRCSDGTYYTGSTKDLIGRFQLHQLGGGSNYTKKRLPVTLVYYEEFDRIEDAFAREKQIQNWSQAKKEALIEKNKDNLKLLAVCKNITNSKHKEYRESINYRSKKIE